MSQVIPSVLHGFIELPSANEYILTNVNIPCSCVYGVDLDKFAVDHDDLALCDIRICDGKIAAIVPPQLVHPYTFVDLEGSCAWPTFVDLHTHIGMSVNDRMQPLHILGFFDCWIEMNAPKIFTLPMFMLLL